jgi:hypothetical protein
MAVSVFHELIPKAIPSQICHMNLGPVCRGSGGWVFEVHKWLTRNGAALWISLYSEIEILTEAEDYCLQGYEEGEPM